MNKILSYILLPASVSAFEARYLERVNRIALAFFTAHLPVLMLIAWGNGTRPLLALALGLLALAGPAVAHRAVSNPRTISVVYGLTAMFFGGLLVHFGQGPVQIEMHFYFFALIAMLTVFANPMVIIAAALTVALHHLALWFVASRSVFNYEAPLWVVLVHASFVVLESIGACYIARNYFDNVIGLEKMVDALDGRNRDMRIVLDNVDQGFVTVDLAGKLSTERSRAFDAWFGAGHEDLFTALGAHSAPFATSLRFGWEELSAAMLPLDLLLDQLPKSFRASDKEYEVSYLAIGSTEPPEKILVVITDVTSQVTRQLAERDEREAMLLFEKLLADAGAVEDYVEESSALVQSITTSQETPVAVQKQRIHTLKGNSAIFGLETVVALCHGFESYISEQGDFPPAVELAKLAARWAVIKCTVERLVGARHNVIEVQPEEHAALEADARKVSLTLARRIRELRYEPTKRRLAHFSEQATRVAARVEKAVEVRANDNGLRLEPKAWAPLWGTLVHAVRNAVDHGLETPAERVAAGKPAQGVLTLRTTVAGDRFVIEVADDGRGIDWKRVALKARERGLRAETTSDLKAALFADGLSTAAEVTEVSGRGVGMGALLDAARALRGVVDIESRDGLGTTLRMTFPVEAMWGLSGLTNETDNTPKTERRSAA